MNGKGKKKFRARRTVMAIAIGSIFASGAQVASALTISGTVNDSSGTLLTVPFNVFTQLTDSGNSAACTTTTTSGAYTGAYICTVANGFTGDVYPGGGLGMLFAKASITTGLTAPVTQDFTARSNDVLTITGTVKDAGAAVSSAGFSLSGSKGSQFDCSAIDSSSGNYTCALDTAAAGVTLKAASTTKLFSGYTVTAAPAQSHDFTARSDVLTITGTVKNASNAVSSASLGLSVSGSKGSSPEWQCSSVDSSSGNYTCVLDAAAAGDTLTATSPAYSFSGYPITATPAQTHDFLASVTRTISGMVYASGATALTEEFAVYTQPTGSGYSTACISTTANGAYTGAYTCTVPDGFTGDVYLPYGANALGKLFAKASITTSLTGPATQDFIPRTDVLTITGNVKNANVAMSSARFGLSLTQGKGSSTQGKGSSPEWNCSTVNSATGYYTCALDTAAAGDTLTATSPTKLFPDYAVTSATPQSHDFSALVTRTISGKVKDSAGKPLSEVNVSGGAQCTQSDGSGFYSCKVPDGFTGSLQFYKTGYLFDLVAYNSAVTADVSALAVSARETLDVTGTIKDSSNASLRGVTVFFVDDSNSWNYCGESDFNGAYQCMVPSGFSGTIHFSKTGYLFDNVTLSKVGTPTAGQDIAALATHTIAGKVTVKDSSGVAIAGANISFFYNNGSAYVGAYCATSNPDGTYTCPVPADATSISVVANKSGYIFKWLNLGSLSDNTPDINITSVDTSLSISGTVRDANENPVSGVSVYGYSADFYINCAEPTGANGAYLCQVPQDFTGTVVVKSGVTATRFPMKNYSVLATDSLNDDIQAIATVTLSGTVMDANGARLAGATVFYDDTGFQNGVNCTSKSGTSSSGSYSCVVPRGLTGHLYAATNDSRTFSRINLTQALNVDTPGLDFTAGASAYTVSGTVSNSNGPVKDASIQWNGSKAGGVCMNGDKTDSNGHYYCVLDAGFSGEIHASKEGYWDQTTVVSHVIDDDSSKNIKLTEITDNFPLCSVNSTVSCVDSLSVTGGKGFSPAGGSVTYKIVKADGSLQVKILNADGSEDISTSGYDSTTRFEIALKLRNYTPRALSGRGRNAAWTIGAPDNDGSIPVTIDISPAPTEIITPVDYNRWPADSADKANYEGGAAVLLTISDLSYYSAEERTPMTGMITVTDAQRYGRLTYTPAGNGKKAELNVSIAGPHLIGAGAGTSHFGFFEAHLPKSMLEYWKITDVSKLIASFLDINSFTVTAEGDGGARIDLPIHYSSGMVRISVQAAAAAPAPTPSYYDPGPSTPTTNTVSAGGTATVGSATTPVEAGAGSTLNVTSGTSGATIDLPAPASTGATTSTVNVVIDGGSLSVKPTESGSVVKTATVSIGGKDTTVLNVTAGTAQVTASAANQPLVSVGSGANAVVISSGSAGATVITSVDKTTGVTSLTLPKSTVMSDADASVKMTIGGQDVNVKPQGGLDVVMTLKTVTVNGVSTQVVSVTGGSATVTSSRSGQPLLAVGGGSGSNAIVVTADTAGTAASSTVNADTGETFLAVSSGVVTLPTNAFAEAGTNGFAAIKDGKIYAGEIAVLNSAGKITGVRLGSQSGSAANVGDSINAASAVGLTMNMTVPNLKGKAARISGTQDFIDVIVGSLGAGFTATGQNSRGVLGLAYPGGSANALPTGDITVDTSRADGVSITGNGKVVVVKSGVIAGFAPAVADPAQLAGLVVALDKNARVTVNEYGVLQATVNGVTYVLQPGWAVDKANSGAAGFSTDAQGRVVYQDGTGNQQTLYPTFADLAQLVAAFKGGDANADATGNDDGTVTAKLQGKTYTLTPDYALTAVSVKHTRDAWWVDGNGKVYVKSGDGKTAQGFAVK